MLEKLREEIDACDKEIMELLKKRLEIVKKIGMYKKHNDLNVYDQQREKVMMDKLKSYKSSDLNEKMIENIYKEIISASKELQKKIR